MLTLYSLWYEFSNDFDKKSYIDGLLIYTTWRLPSEIDFQTIMMPYVSDFGIIFVTKENWSLGTILILSML